MIQDIERYRIEMKLVGTWLRGRGKIGLKEVDKIGSGVINKAGKQDETNIIHMHSVPSCTWTYYGPII